VKQLGAFGRWRLRTTAIGEFILRPLLADHIEIAEKLLAAQLRNTI
jgi:hypothetical protein